MGSKPLGGHHQTNCKIINMVVATFPKRLATLPFVPGDAVIIRRMRDVAPAC